MRVRRSIRLLSDEAIAVPGRGRVAVEVFACELPAGGGQPSAGAASGRERAPGSAPRAKLVFTDVAGHAVVAEPEDADAVASVPSDLAAWCGALAVGARVDARDNQGTWYQGTIVDAESDGRFRVHFTGFAERWDEWFMPDSPSLAVRARARARCAGSPRGHACRLSCSRITRKRLRRCQSAAPSRCCTGA